MSVISLDQVAPESKIYNEMFDILYNDIISQHSTLKANESVGNKANVKDIRLSFFALNYAFLLYLLKNELGGIDYWKSLTDYEAIKNCFLGANISLDALILTYS